MVSSGKVESYEEANEKLVQAMSISADEGETIDLTQYDPLEEAVLEIQPKEEVEEAVTAAQAAIQLEHCLLPPTKLEVIQVPSSTTLRMRSLSLSTKALAFNYKNH